MTTFNPNRRIGGRRAQKAGGNLERAIVSGAAAGLVRLVNLPSHGARFISRDKAIRQNMPCDFVGCFIGTGRALFFDAKAVGNERASIRVHDPAIVKPHQAAFLMSMGDAGAVAGLLIQCERLALYLWLDADYLNEGAAIGWDDPRFVSLGSTAMTPSFARLVARFAGTAVQG